MAGAIYATYLDALRLSKGAFRATMSGTLLVLAVARCMRLLAIAAGRDYEHCGKAACARSRRCRGFACEPDDDDD